MQVRGLAPRSTSCSAGSDVTVGAPGRPVSTSTAPAANSSRPMASSYPQLGDVGSVDRVAHQRLAAHRGHRANPAIGHHRTERGDLRRPVEPAQQLGAIAGEHHRPHARRRRGRFDQHAVGFVELVHGGALQDTAPCDDVVVEATGQHRRRVQREVAPESRMPANCAAPQQPRRLGGASGNDDRVGEHVERRAVGPAGPHAARASVPMQHPFHPRLRDDPRARRARLGQRVEVHTELGVAWAADCALTTAFAARRVAWDAAPPSSPATPRRRVAGSVAAHDVQRHRRDPQGALDVVEVGCPAGPDRPGRDRTRRASGAARQAVA